MSDNASWSNETTRSRKTDDHLGIPGFFGLQNLLVKALPERRRRHAGRPRRIHRDGQPDREHRQGRRQPCRGDPDEPRRGDHADAAQRQSGDPGPAGGPGQFRDARGDGGRHRPARRTSRPRTRSATRRSPSCASAMAAVARSPTCSSRATARRRSTSCCPTEPRAALARRRAGRRPVSQPAQRSTVERSAADAHHSSMRRSRKAQLSAQPSDWSSSQ